MKNYLHYMLSLFFILGFNGLALAIDDSTGENIGPIDLLSADAEIYERPDGEIFLKLSVEANPHLPGTVVFECDLDNSTGTGGTISMLGAPISPCSCKTEPGFDIAISLFIREQGDSSSSAFCASCTDNQGPCARRRRSGQWYAMTSVGGQPTRNLGILSGLLNPLPRLPGSGQTEDCYTLPWGQIVYYANQDQQETTPGNPSNFNYAKARANNYGDGKWQASIWYDPVFADQDDVASGSFPTQTFDASDWAPDVGKADMQQADAMTFCEANFNGDTDVDAEDVELLLEDYGRSTFFNPCPSCRP